MMINKYITYSFLLLAIMFCSGQAQTDSLPTKEKAVTDSVVKIGIRDTLYSEIGIASFYAKRFEGRRCASGERFQHDKLTAAHKTLKMGTWVKVVNLKNDSVVIVKINDRLPKNSKRCIDLTWRAAKQLNFVSRGLTKVKIEKWNILEQRSE